MSGNVAKLKPKQQAGILALLSNRTVEDAARAGDLERGDQFLPSLHEKFEQLRVALQEAGWA